MDRKRFAKYFAQKPPVVLYVVGGVLLAAGVLIVLIQGGVYNAMSYYIGIPAAVLGLLILGVTRGIVIRDAEADKQLDLLAARADAELPDALRLTAKELETDRVPFKSYIYENDDAKYKRGTDKRLRSSEIGAGVFLLCNTRFCALYRTASLVEEREDVCAFEAAYAGEPFVTLMPEGQLPEVKHVTGSNRCAIGFVVDERLHRVVVCAVLDNLLKGAAGQAEGAAHIIF